MNVGAGVGALTSGKLAHKLGRQRVLYLTNYLMLIGIAVNLIPFTPTFMIGRFISGMTAGVGASIPAVYIS